MSEKTTAAKIELELDNGTTLSFAVERNHYIAFVNAASKNSFNAMNNLLAASVTPASREALTELLQNPANVPELVAAVMEEYKPDVAVTVKKRSK